MTVMSKHDFSSVTAAVEQHCRSMKKSSDLFMIITLISFVVFGRLTPYDAKLHNYATAVLTVILVWIAVWRFNMILIGLSDLLEDLLTKPSTPNSHFDQIFADMQFVLKTATGVYKRNAFINAVVLMIAIVLNFSDVGKELEIWRTVAIGFLSLNCLSAFGARAQLFLYRKKRFNSAPS